MKRIKLIGISIVSVVVIILASSSNVVGYQTVQSTNQIKINNEVNQRELLFQTIADIANNKEIQQIILKSQINREDLFFPDEKFPTLNTPILTKNRIKQFYFIGSLFTRMFSKSKMQSMFEQYQFNNQEMQKEITAVIKKDAILDREVTQLLNSECDCDNEKTSSWDFPILCRILYIISSICFLWAFWGGFTLLGWLASFFPGDLIEMLILYPRALMAILVLFICSSLATLFDCYWIIE